MKIRDEYYVSLKGKRYPLYAGVLVAAMENGLRCLETQIIQAPTDENGQVAIVMATATFEGTDGRDRVFTDVGDASPRNTSPQIATAALRMASTRAKGRALRDGIGLGETLKEELPDGVGGNDEETTPSANQARAARPVVARDAAPRPARPDAGADAAPAAAPALPASFCATCGVEVEEAVAQLAIKHFAAVYCVTHGRAELAARRAAAEREVVGISEEE